MFRQRALLLLGSLYLLCALGYLAVVPPLEGFDSLAHMNYANYLRKEARLPVIDGETVNFSYELATQPPTYFLSVAAATAWLPYADADVWVRASENSYFPGKSLRWSVDLPDMPPAVARSILLARLVSLLGGAVTLWATLRLIGLWFPGQSQLAAAVVAVAVLNPLFLFMSVIVSNDLWSVALTALILWQVVSAPIRGPRAWRRWLLIGGLAGLAVTTKYSAVLTALPALFVLWTRRREFSWRVFARLVAVAIAGALLTGGYWYLRNVWLYGEIIPLGAAGEVIRSLNRDDPMGPAELWSMLPWLLHSYWGVFVSILAPAAYFRTVDLLVALAGIGLVVAAARRQLPPGRIMGVVLLWAGVYVAGVLYWTATVSYGEQARLGLAAAPALALLLVLGWQALVSRRYRSLVHGLVTAMMVGVALWPLPTLRAAYATPESLPLETAVASPLDARTEDGVVIYGYGLPAGGALVAGSALPLDLYLGAERVIEEDLTLFVHLVDGDDRLLYQFDGVAFDGRHPTRQWRPGERFREVQSVSIEAPELLPREGATAAELIVGFYPFESPDARLVFRGADGAEIGDRLVLGPVRVLAELPQLTMPDETPFAAWTNGIELLATLIDAGGDSTSQSRVQLTWRTTRPIATSLTLFVQVLDASGDLLWQIDRLPGNGRVPTSTWLAFESIGDVETVQLPDGWQRVIVGWYDARSGVRIPLETGDDYLTIFER